MCTLGNPARAFSVRDIPIRLTKSGDWCNIYLIKAPGSNRHCI